MVNQKLVFTDVKYLATATMTQNNRNHKLCNYLNNGYGSWWFHLKDVNKDFSYKKGNMNYFCFVNYATNEVIHFYWLMYTSYEFLEEEKEEGNDRQDTGHIFLSSFVIFELLIKRVYYTLLIIFHSFMFLVWLYICLFINR